MLHTYCDGILGQQVASYSSLLQVQALYYALYSDLCTCINTCMYVCMHTCVILSCGLWWGYILFSFPIAKAQNLLMKIYIHVDGY